MKTAAASHNQRVTFKNGGKTSQFATDVAANATPAQHPQTMLAKEIPFGVTPERASVAARFLKKGHSRVLSGRRPVGSVGIGQRPMKYMPAMSSAMPPTLAGLIGVP